MKDSPGDRLPEEDPGWQRPDEPFPGARFLRARTSLGVLDLLDDGDPLALELRVDRACNEQGFLLARETVVARTFALVAYHAPSYRGVPPLGTWLQGLVNAALVQLLERQLGEELAAIPVAESEDLAFYERISSATRLPLERTRRACLALNGLEPAERLAFWGVVVERESIREFALRHELPEEVVRAHVREALRRLSEGLRPEPDLDEFLRRGEEEW